MNDDLRLHHRSPSPATPASATASMSAAMPTALPASMPASRLIARMVGAACVLGLAAGAVAHGAVPTPRDSSLAPRVSNPAPRDAIPTPRVSIPAPRVPPLPAHLPLGERELFPLDPVILIGAGDRMEGSAERESTYGNYRYRFATEASKRAFDAMPSRFAIAFGGGCGRMGPLSGTGDVSRFEVVGERLYIFASDACRASFVQEAAKASDAGAPAGTTNAFLEVIDAPFPTDARGLELSTAARRWLRADAACPREIVMTGQRTERTGTGDAAVENRVREEVRLAPNLVFTELSGWNDDAWWTTATFGAEGAATSGGAAANARRSTAQPEQPLDDAQFEAFRRVAMLEPLFLARILLQSDVKLAGGGAAEWKVGEKTLAGEILRVHWRGVTVEWLLKAATGQPVAQRAMKRARDARFALVTEALSNWNDRAGVRVPLTRHDGVATRNFDTVDSDCNPPQPEAPSVRAEP